MLDLSNNKLSEIPLELSDCSKLKEINFKGNKLSDKRLEKMVNGCQTKSILDYLRGKGKGRQAEAGGEADKGKKQQQKKKKEKVGVKQDEVEELTKVMVRVLHASDAPAALTVQVGAQVKDVRPYLVCCVVRGMHLKPGNALKRFLVAQVSLKGLGPGQFCRQVFTQRPNLFCFPRQSFMKTCATKGPQQQSQLTICSWLKAP